MTVQNAYIQCKIKYEYMDYQSVCQLFINTVESNHNNHMLSHCWAAIHSTGPDVSQKTTVTLCSTDVAFL